MKPELISFDAAGTLIDVNWQPGHFAVRCALDTGVRLDPQVGAETYSRLLHTRWRSYCDINQTRDDSLCDAFWRDLASDWLKQMNAPQTALEPMLELADTRLYGLDETFRLYPDVLSTLNELTEKGWRMVVLSNWDYTLHRILKNLGVSNLFEHVFASLQEGPEKPDPRLFSIVSEQVGVAPEAILHVGDSWVDDLNGARNVGWQAILLDRTANGYHPPVISSLDQVQEALTWFA
jgi:putative hydrolase of the HAD superfamily